MIHAVHSIANGWEKYWIATDYRHWPKLYIIATLI